MHKPDCYCAIHGGRPKQSRPATERFWLYVVPMMDDRGCWEWAAKICRNGYGMISVEKHRSKKLLAHRLSYEMHFGPIAPGLVVCHRCDNPSCVNPHHLWLGTQDENMADMKRKGRAWRRGV